MPEPPPNSVHPLTLAEWRACLAAKYTRCEGVWLVTYKKASGTRHARQTHRGDRASRRRQSPR
jgi:hypothetical protein